MIIYKRFTTAQDLVPERDKELDPTLVRARLSYAEACAAEVAAPSPIAAKRCAEALDFLRSLERLKGII
jgi:hypothetical protein